MEKQANGVRIADEDDAKEPDERRWSGRSLLRKARRRSADVMMACLTDTIIIFNVWVLVYWVWSMERERAIYVDTSTYAATASKMRQRQAIYQPSTS